MTDIDIDANPEVTTPCSMGLLSRQLRIGAQTQRSLHGGFQPVRCPACQGTGTFWLTPNDSQRCVEWDCNGTGQVMGYAVIIKGRRYESTSGLS